MDNNYKTSDLGLAAYLTYKDFVIDNIEDGDGRKKTFVFSRKPGHKIEDEAQKYVSGQTEVEPRKYFNELRDIKSRLYDHAALNGQLSRI